MRGMASVNQTQPRCVNQMGKTHSKPLAARHGRGTAWARHAICESAIRLLARSHGENRRFSQTCLTVWTHWLETPPRCLGVCTVFH